MSYKSFADLNSAMASFSIDPIYEMFNRIYREIEGMSSLAKSIPVDWARAYAGVMVLKYASDGTPTDVTDTVAVNGIDAPNSLISDLKRRFYTIYDQYVKDKAAFASTYPMSAQIAAFDLAQTTQAGDLLAAVNLSSNTYVEIGTTSGSDYITVRTGQAPSIPNSIFSIMSGTITGTAKFAVNWQTISKTNHKWSAVGGVEITINDSQGFKVTGYYSYIGSNGNNSVSKINMLDYASFDNQVSLAGSGVSNIHSSSRMNTPVQINDVAFDISSLIMSNDSAISALKSAIDAL